MSDEIHPLDSLEANASVPPPTPPRSVLQNVFLGPHGLRAGWKVLIFVAIFCGVQLLGWLLASLRTLLGAGEDMIFMFPWWAGMGLLSPGIWIAILIYDRANLWFTIACNAVAWSIFAAVIFAAVKRPWRKQ